MLRRCFIVVLLAICLPLQGSLAMALGYCLHEDETSTSTQQPVHAGHHEHQHAQPSKASKPLDQGQQGQKKAAAEAASLDHGDCAQCHFACNLGVPSDCASQFALLRETLRPQDAPPRAGVAPDAIERVPLVAPTSASF